MLSYCSSKTDIFLSNTVTVLTFLTIIPRVGHEMVDSYSQRGA